MYRCIDDLVLRYSVQAVHLHNQTSWTCGLNYLERFTLIEIDLFKTANPINTCAGSVETGFAIVFNGWSHDIGIFC